MVTRYQKLYVITNPYCYNEYLVFQTKLAAMNYLQNIYTNESLERIEDAIWIAYNRSSTGHWGWS